MNGAIRPIYFAWGLSVATPATPTLTENIRRACALDQTTYAEIVGKQVREFPASTWIQACEQLRNLGFDRPADILKRAPNVLIKADLTDVPRALAELDFKDPRKMIATAPAILTRSVAKTIGPMLAGLAALGFRDPKKMIESVPTLLGLSVERNVRPKLAALRSLGFKNPSRLVERVTSLLHYNVGRGLRPKIAQLRALGFKKPLGLIERVPEILQLNVAGNVRPKIAALAEMGFKKPARMVERFPQLLTLSTENCVRPKISALRDLGFVNPLRLIETFPMVLGLDVDRNVRAKIAALADLGFENPRRAIESAPSLLGLRIENIRPKLAALTDLGLTDVIEVVNRAPTLLLLNVEANVGPKIEHLRDGWDVELQTIRRDPALLSASLERLRELRGYLDEREFLPSVLPPRFKAGVIKGLAKSDLEFQFRHLEAYGHRGQAALLADPRRWKTLFRKATCERRLTPRSLPPGEVL